MNKLIAGLLLAVLAFVTPAFAGADPAPTDASLHKLLEVTDVRKLLDNMLGQVDKMMKSTIQQMLKGQKLSPEQQELSEAMQAKMVTVLKEELSWEVLEPIYLKVYRESLTQSEVDGMLAFYSSPTGQSVIRKMPLIMQSSMAAMQERLAPMLERMQQMAKETAEEIKAKGQQSGSG